MSRKPYVLYDEDGNPTYYSGERVLEMLRAVSEFGVYRSSFEKDGKNADVGLGYIKRVRDLIPKEIRGRLPNKFRLSNKALGELETKCKWALGKVLNKQ